MNIKILLIATNDIHKIKISVDLWRKLHHEQKHYFFNKEYKIFLDKYGLKPTTFNLNCLDELRGVILTELQIFNIMKGGLKE